jgi:hypothetical protein
VRIDDTRRRGVESRIALQRRLQTAGFVPVDQAEVGYAVARTLREEGLQNCLLLRAACDHQLLDAPVTNATLGAKPVEHVATRDAQPGLETAGGIVKPSMDNLAVPRSYAGANGAFGLEHQDLATAARQRPRHGQAHDTRTDDHDVHAIGDHCPSGLPGSSVVSIGIRSSLVSGIAIA